MVQGQLRYRRRSLAIHFIPFLRYECKSTVNSKRGKPTAMNEGEVHLRIVLPQLGMKCQSIPMLSLS